MAAEITQTRAQMIASLVCRARDDAGLNNTSLAQESGVPRRTIVRITNGQGDSGPELDTLAKIAQATRKPLSYFHVGGGASDRVRTAAEGLVEALVDELRERLATEGIDA